MHYGADIPRDFGDGALGNHCFIHVPGMELGGGEDLVEQSLSRFFRDHNRLNFGVSAVERRRLEGTLLCWLPCQPNSSPSHSSSGSRKPVPSAAQRRMPFQRLVLKHS